MKYTIAILFTFFFIGASQAQGKIGYANLQMVLAYMPETKNMDQAIQSRQAELTEKIRIKEQYAQGKMDEYLQKKESGASQAELTPLEDALIKLDAELQSFSSEAEAKLAAFREELLTPIINKIQKELDGLRLEKGYSLILNTTDGAGVSVVLSGSSEDDLTRELLKRLGVATE